MRKSFCSLLVVSLPRMTELDKEIDRSRVQLKSQQKSKFWFIVLAIYSTCTTNLVCNRTVFVHVYMYLPCFKPTFKDAYYSKEESERCFESHWRLYLLYLVRLISLPLYPRHKGTCCTRVQVEEWYNCCIAALETFSWAQIPMNDGYRH